MDSPKSLDVADWEDSPQPAIAEYRALPRFLSPTVLGILGTLLLHALVIQSVPFGSRSPKLEPTETQESANALSKSKIDTDGLTLISLPVIVSANPPVGERALPSFPDLSGLKINSQISVDPPAFLNLETLSLSEERSSNSIAVGEVGTEQERLLGIYTGQIRARIDRVWRRPRTPVNGNPAGQEPADANESFECEATIIQDIRGNVQEILLPRCNGSAPWRKSLVLAIQHASPLPAPPSNKVFSASISLNFLGLNYFAGAPDDDYEPERRTLMGAQ